MYYKESLVLNFLQVRKQYVRHAAIRKIHIYIHVYMYYM